MVDQQLRVDAKRAPVAGSEQHLGAYNDPLTPLVLLERTARVFPRKEAVVYGRERMDWRAFAGLVGRFAAALRRDGIEPGDRVAVLLPNVPVHLASTFAVPLAGAALVAINTRLAAGEVAYILKHSGAKLVLVDPELAGQVDLGQVGPELRVVNVLDPQVGLTEAKLPGPTFDEWIAGAEPLPIENTAADERQLLSINYTSGTTGRPKGVMYTHRGAYLNALGEIGALRLGQETVFLWTLPMFHCNGWCMTWAVTGAAGTHVCIRAVRPPEIIRLVQEEGVTNFNGAPTVLRMIAADPAAQGLRFDPPVAACTGGAPPSPADLKRMEAMGIHVTHLYGLTETYGPHTLCEIQPEWRDLPLEERAELTARQGVPYVFSTHLRVADPETMEDVPPDGETMGEVMMRGNNVMAGYFDDEEATARALRGGWFHSGDLAVMHPDGYIELRDRSKDIIISGGENISSIEVENAIYEHPAVHEVAIVGVPDERWGEVPKAFIALKPGASATAEEIIAFTRERLSHFKCPKHVEFAELPKTSTGKIQKYVLREKEWSGTRKRVN
ncbi:MAG: long-chain-fatty-acid--CoA ligase [Chloroflexi bacterium]|nr:long-chain-fatty-acid--CoA ligase [Chloroflexota bacterium]